MMIGTTEWISRVENSLKETTSNSENTNNTYVTQILRQGKRISQLISYIWLNQDTETAAILDKYFKRGDEGLKELLFAEDPESKEYKLLLAVFGERYFPIFSKQDKKFINFRVATNTFEGSINDPGAGEHRALTVTIPYPPCPNIFDDISEGSKEIPVERFTVIKKSELKGWVESSPEKEPYFFKDNPYIPATTC